MFSKSKLKMYIPLIAFSLMALMLFYQVMNQNNKNALIPMDRVIPNGTVISLNLNDTTDQNYSVDMNGAPLNVETLIQQESERQSEERELSDLLKDEVSLVHFFATWCGPCMGEYQGWVEYAKTSPVPIYGIAYKDEDANVKSILSNKGNPFRDVFVDAEGKIGIEWGIYGVPETFVIDKKGRVRYRYTGAIAKEDFEKVFKRALLELNSESPVEPNNK